MTPLPASVLLDMRDFQVPNPSTVRNPEVTTVGGVKVEVDWEIVQDRFEAYARITLADGRELNACWVPHVPVSQDPGTARRLLGDLTCRFASHAFRAGSTPLPELEEMIAERLTAVVETGIELVRMGRGGEWTLGRVRRASLCLSEDEFKRYTDQSGVQFNAEYVSELRDARISPEQAKGLVTRYDESADRWVRVPRPSQEIAVVGVYLSFGWSTEEYMEFQTVWQSVQGVVNVTSRVPPTHWSSFPFAVASVAVQAHLSASDVRLMVDAGAWDVDAVRLLGVLN